MLSAVTQTAISTCSLALPFIPLSHKESVLNC